MTGRIVRILVAVVLASTLLVTAQSSTSALALPSPHAVQEWPTWVPTGSPRLLVPGPDDVLWATSTGNDYVYRFDPTDGALLSAFYISGGGHFTHAHLAAGPDGNMWLTAAHPTATAGTTTANELVRMSPDGIIDRFPITKGNPAVAANAGPRGIVKGPPSDPCSMWFGESAGGNLLGRFDLNGLTPGCTGTPPAGSRFTHFAIAGYAGSNFSMTLGPDENGTAGRSIWFATHGNSNGDDIVRVSVTPTGAPTVTLTVELPGADPTIPGSTAWDPFDMTAGRPGTDDGIWVTDDLGNRFARVKYNQSATDLMTVWPVNLSDPNPPNGNSQGATCVPSTQTCTSTARTPTTIIVGPDDKIWMSVKAINSVARFDPDTGVFDQQFRGKSSIVRPVGIAEDPVHHNIWYSSVDTGRMGRILRNSVAEPTPASGSTWSLSGTFKYKSPASVTPYEQDGFPLGIVANDDTMDVAMSQSDRIQRVPLDLAGGPPTADNEQQIPQTASKTNAEDPWRTIRPHNGGQPRKFAKHGKNLWVTMNADTVWQIAEADDGTTTWTPRVTATGLAACCLTASGLVYLSGPDGIVATQQSEVWFTMFTAGHIARADTGALQEEPPVPELPTGPTDIVATSDGTLWFTETKAGTIGRRDRTTGAITHIAVGAEPYGMTVASDGKVWFTLRGENKIGYINPTNLSDSDTYAMPTANSQPTAITRGSDGLYITEYLTGKVARYVPGVALPWTEWSLPYGSRSYPFWLAPDSAGKIWVTLPYRNEVARLN